MEKAISINDIIRADNHMFLMDSSFSSFYEDLSPILIQNPVTYLSRFISIHPDRPLSMIIFGQRGSGKSTTLWKLANDLESTYHTIKFNVSDLIDIVDFSHIDYLFATIKVLLEEIRQLNCRIDPSLLDRLYRYLHDDTLISMIKFDRAEAGDEAGTKIGFVRAITNSIISVLRTGIDSKTQMRAYLDPILHHIFQGATQLIDVLSQGIDNQKNMPVLIVDGLDHLPRHTAKQFLINQKYLINDLNIHTIYTFSSDIQYCEQFQDIVSSFNIHVRLYMLPIYFKNHEPNEPAFELIERLVYKRIDASLLDKEALKFLIEKSGGSLFYLFEMIKNAAMQVLYQQSNGTSLTIKDAKQAYQNLISDFEKSLLRRHGELLSRLLNDFDRSLFQIDENIVELISLSAIIEYCDDAIRYDFHPAVKDSLGTLEK